MDDYLNLGMQPLAGYQLLLFTGVSSTGKTTYLRWLYDQHPNFHHANTEWINRLAPRKPRRETTVIFYDEILTLVDVWRVRRWVQQGIVVVAASHIRTRWLKYLVGICRLHEYRLDARPDKITRWLDQHGISYDLASLDRYLKAYGACFGPLQIILTHTGQAELGRAQLQFEASCVTNYR